MIPPKSVGSSDSTGVLTNLGHGGCLAACRMKVRSFLSRVLETSVSICPSQGFLAVRQYSRLAKMAHQNGSSNAQRVTCCLLEYTTFRLASIPIALPFSVTKQVVSSSLKPTEVNLIIFVWQNLLKDQHSCRSPFDPSNVCLLQHCSGSYSHLNHQVRRPEMRVAVHLPGGTFGALGYAKLVAWPMNGGSGLDGSVKPAGYVTTPSQKVSYSTLKNMTHGDKFRPVSLSSLVVRKQLSLTRALHSEP